MQINEIQINSKDNSFRFVDVEGGTGLMGLVIKEDQETKAPSQQCFPLYSYIKALNHPTINLLRYNMHIYM